MPANIMCCITDTVSKRLFIKFQQYFTCNFFQVYISNKEASKTCYSITSGNKM